MSIRRAQMVILIGVPRESAKRVQERLAGLLGDGGAGGSSEGTSESESVTWVAGECEIRSLVDPGRFAAVEETVRNETKGKGRVEVMSWKNAEEGDSELE